MDDRLYKILEQNDVIQEGDQYAWKSNPNRWYDFLNYSGKNTVRYMMTIHPKMFGVRRKLTTHRADRLMEELFSGDKNA